MRTTAREIKLLEKCLKGNSQAFEEIVAKYQELVCAITFSGVTDVQQSEELAHQTFINAWKNLSQLKDLAKFSPWLRTIARNNIRNFFNKNQRDIIAKTKAMENINDTAAADAGPLESAIKKEHEKLVSDAIRRIPEQYREPLVLYYRQQQSVKQVALSLDLSQDVVKQRLQRGRKMIKEQLSSIVEETLSATGPKKAFTTAVIASIAGITVKGTSVAAAAGIAAGMSKTGTTTGVAALMSGVTAKIITAAAVAAIGVGAVVTYKHITKDNKDIEAEKVVTVADEQELPEDKLTSAKVEDAGMESGILRNKTVETVVTKPSEVEAAAAADPCQEHVGTTEYQFKAKGVLSGLVTDIETDEPVVNTEVILSSRNYRTKTDETDENGFYSFDTISDDGNYQIGVFSKDYIGIVEDGKQTRIHLKKDSQFVKHFQLPKACMVDTYVVDEDGNPIPDTRLWVTSLAEERGRIIKSSIGSQQTDKDGYALLGGLAAAKTQYLITAVHTKYGKWIKENNRKYREQIREYGPGYFKITLQDPNIIEYCQIVLKKGDTVRGIAKYTDGTPAKECKIVPRPDWWHSLYSSPQYPIDPNGSFTLSQITPGTYQIQVSIPHGGGGATVPNLFTTKLPLGNGKLLEVTVPRKPTKVSSGGRRTRQDKPKPKLYGVVTDEVTGQPVNDFRIRYKKIKGNYFGSIGTWSRFSDTKGKFKLDVPGSEDAICKVQAVANGYASQWSEQIDTANNSAVSIKLTRGGSIVGTVVDEQGNAVENAKVLPFSLAGSVKSSRPLIFASEEGAVSTNKNGRFTLKNLAVGTEYLKAVHPKHTYLISSAISVGQGQQNDIGNLVLENGGTLEGFVYDNQGKPQPNITLHAKNHYMFSSSKVQYATATTDPNGFYRMKHLPGELIYITQGNTYQKTGVVSQGIVPSNNESTQLDFGGGPVVKGRIVLNGKPLAQTKLNLALGDPIASGLYRCQAYTDENGQFMLRAGIPATYTLSYDKRTKVSTSQNFKLLDVVVDQKDIDLGVIPAKGKTLRVQVEILGETEEKVRWFLLRENDPLYGPCVYWVDQPALSDMPLQIDNLRPGFYYAIAHLDGRGQYILPIEITRENDSFDITFPIQDGHITLTGTYPQDISHVRFTNKDMTIFKFISASRAKETGKYRIDGLLPGTYFLNPKWPDFTDCLVVTIPNTYEYTFDLDLAVLQEKLKENLFIHVMDEDGYPVENAAIWIECNGKILRPAWYDGYSGRFYPRGGEHIIHAEKDGLNAQKACEFYIDKYNTASGEARETFIQFQRKNNE
ncbi:MAG: sigma-70 family RNA polymerase sigma factor [Planctomycetota bacterium]|jgi:RNA polymerase sigma factor (sigma-70 family)